ADGNDDGIVDGEDLQIWTRHFGEPATATGAAVPEPSAAWLLPIGVAVIGRCRKRSVLPRRRLSPGCGYRFGDGLLA
ncbi:MAG TPA: PEP-CTERM sorting domain-containing protein, partial [Lacipirellula sp.]